MRAFLETKALRRRLQRSDGRIVTRQMIHAAVVTFAVGTSVPAQAVTAGPQAEVRALGGVVIRYPASWQAASAQEGRVVVVAGPRDGTVRPVATILIARGAGDARALLESAASGLGVKSPLRLLGERVLGRDRRARYYVRGTDAASEYVMVGVAQGGGWIATMVAIDVASDPGLATHAAVFQRILVDLLMPVRESH